MLTGLLLALRALWWRRGLSAAVLGVSAVVVAVAVAGPTYDRAAKESVLQDGLRSAPLLESGLDVTDFAPQPALDSLVATALHATGMTGYGTPIEAQEAPYLGSFTCARTVTLASSACNATVAGLVASRTGVLTHLHISGGRVPRAAGEVVASTVFLQQNALRVGDVVTPQGAVPTVADGQATSPSPVFTPLRIVGSYTTDEASQYWFQRPYFAAFAAAGPMSPPYEDALFALPSTLSEVQYEAVVDLPLDTAAIRVATAASYRSRVAALKARLNGGVLTGGIATTELPAVLSAAAGNEHALGTPILLIVLQLLLLCGLVLFGAVRAAAEARGPEVALAKLRQFRPVSVLVFGLAEPLLLAPLALPIGLGLGWLTTIALSRGQLLSGTPVALPPVALLAAVGAVAGAVAATIGVGVRIATRPISAQWRRASQRPAGRPWWIDAVVVAAAVAGLVVLAVGGGIGRFSGQAKPDPRALAAPALLGLAVAMVGSRLLPLVCRRLYARTERGGLAGFLAVRQIARRPTTLAVSVLLAVALALATFAISAYDVAQRNRHDVAGVQVGAAVSVPVQVPAGLDLGALVDAADPGGRQAMAVTESPEFAADNRLLVGVQPDRLASVAYWRGDFAHGRSLGSVARSLQVTGLHAVTVTGTQLAVDTTSTAVVGAPIIRLTADVISGGETYLVSGSPLPADGPARTVLTLPSCADGCRLAGLILRRDDSGATDLSGTVAVSALQQRSTAPGWTPVPAALSGGAAGWRATTPDGPGYATSVSGVGALVFRFHLPWQQPPEITPYDVPASLPVVSTDPEKPGTALVVGGLDGQRLGVTVATRAATVPAAGDLGLLVDRALAIRAAGQTDGVRNQLWLTAHADPLILRRLQSDGVVLGERESIATTESGLGRQGPPLALALFRIGAVVAAILALGGTALTLALAARRRGFELAALLAQGVGRRALLRALTVEQVVLLGYGTVLGIAAGLLGAIVALPSVPEFVTTPAAPRLLFTPPYLSAGIVTIVLGVLVALGSVAGSALLVRRVSPDRLREYAP